MERERVLFLACDEAPRRVVWRRRRLNAGAELPLDVLHGQRLWKRKDWGALGAALLTHRVVVIDGLRAALGVEDGWPGSCPAQGELAERLAQLHVLAMTTRTAILLVDHRPYPPRPEEMAGDDDDPWLDVMGTGLFLADAAGQIEAVWTLMRRRGEPLGVVAAPDGGGAQIVRIPLGRRPADRRRPADSQGPAGAQGPTDRQRPAGTRQLGGAPGREGAEPPAGKLRLKCAQGPAGTARAEGARAEGARANGGEVQL